MKTLLFSEVQSNPKLILDLNYSENSPGREYAHQVSARYISGKLLFVAQAKAQRAFWDECVAAEKSKMPEVYA